MNTRGCCLPTSCQQFVDTSLIVSNANLAWLPFSQGPCNARILQQVLGAQCSLCSFYSFKYMLVSLLWFRVDVDCKDRKLPFRVFCVCFEALSLVLVTPENEAFGSSLDNRTKQGRLGWTWWIGFKNSTDFFFLSSMPVLTNPLVCG